MWVTGALLQSTQNHARASGHARTSGQCTGDADSIEHGGLLLKRIMAIVTNNGTATWNAVLGTEAGGMNDIMYQRTMSPR